MPVGSHEFQEFKAELLSTLREKLEGFKMTPGGPQPIQGEAPSTILCETVAGQIYTTLIAEQVRRLSDKDFNALYSDEDIAFDFADQALTVARRLATHWFDPQQRTAPAWKDGATPTAEEQP